MRLTSFSLLATLCVGLPLMASASDTQHTMGHAAAHGAHNDMAQIVEHGALRISDAYARASSPVAKSGAAFLVIENIGSLPDQLIAATSPAAQKVELHTHIMKADGVMQMTQVEGGFAIPASGAHALARGGDHVMFMGLTEPWAHGDKIEVTLTFKVAGDITLTIPVDLDRKPDASAHGAHGS